MADYSSEEAAGAPSFTIHADDLDHYDKVIIKLTIKNLDLPKNTRKTREFISFAYYKNLAREDTTLPFPLKKLL